MAGGQPLRLAGGQRSGDLHRTARDAHQPDKAWTVDQLSQAAGLSRTAFNKRFTTLVGKPPMAYLTGCA